MPSRTTRIALAISLAFAVITRAQAQPTTHIYQFNGTLNESGIGCGPALTAEYALGGCTHAADGGQFQTDQLPNCAYTRTVYHNNMNWGLAYSNPGGVIGDTYTIHLYIKATDFGTRTWARIIDFSNGQTDGGIYFQATSSAPTRCLDFYPQGIVGACPYFTTAAYYLLSFTRNGATGRIDIYVNSVLFSSYNDAAGNYKGAAGKPVYIFRDDKVVSCESGEANFAWLSFSNTYASQTDVNTVYQDICAAANKHISDFTLSASQLCAPGPATVTYTGYLPGDPALYNFTWDWGDGEQVSGTGQGPFTVNWKTAGQKKVSLTVTSPCAGSTTTTQTLNISDNLDNRLLGLDTAICPGDHFSLQAPQATQLPGVVWAWQDGATAATTTIAQAGKYWIQLQQGACIYSDTLEVTQKPEPPVFHSKDTAICENTSLPLDVSATGNAWTWQDGSTGPRYIAHPGGKYTVQISLDGCHYADSITIHSLPLPKPNLGPDQVICSGEQLTLQTQDPAVYRWQDGSTTGEYHVTGPGLYILQETNTCGTASDTIDITEAHCVPEFPNAFTPGGPGNNLFRALHTTGVTHFHLAIFNRYGQKVFQTQDPNGGWDGRTDGRLQAPGTYPWTASYTDAAGRTKTRKGILVLIQ